MWLFYISRVKNCERNLPLHLRGPLVFSNVFLFLMIKRREKEGGKAFFCFHSLVLTVSFFTYKAPVRENKDEGELKMVAALFSRESLEHSWIWPS